MSKLKWLVTFALLLACAHGARGQCTGQYANDPTYAMLIPKDYAAQGNVAVTLNINGGHKLTVGEGTWATAYWQTWNVGTDQYGKPLLSAWFSIDNGQPQPWFAVTSMNGSVDVYISPSYANHVITYYLVGSGISSAGANQSTQDRVAITETSQSQGTYFNDDLDTNFYWQTVTTGGGSSMLTSCQECEGGTTQHCINATHTPYSTIQLTNSTSGESQLIQGVQAGNAAHSNESVSFSASLAISVLPGDTGTISIDDKIICSMDGVIFEQTLPKPKTSPSGGSWNPSMTAELAFTKMALKVPTHCTPKLDASGKTIGLICDVAYYCSARSSPPDYQPTKLVTYYYTDPASVPTYWMTMSPGTALVFGKNQPGEIAVWYFPLSTVQQVLTGMGLPDPLLLDIFSLAWVSDSSTQDCTKWISGITPWYMPKW